MKFEQFHQQLLVLASTLSSSVGKNCRISLQSSVFLKWADYSWSVNIIVCQRGRVSSNAGSSGNTDTL